jgi:hypothetical protein
VAENTPWVPCIVKLSKYYVVTIPESEYRSLSLSLVERESTVGRRVAVRSVCLTGSYLLLTYSIVLYTQPGALTFQIYMIIM